MSVVHFEYEGRFRSRTIPCGTPTASGNVESTESIEDVTCQRCRRTTPFRVNKNMAEYANRRTAKAKEDSK